METYRRVHTHDPVDDYRPRGQPGSGGALDGIGVTKKKVLAEETLRVPRPKTAA